MTQVVIIADDLTGALDAASPFACRGARTICFTNPEAIDADAASHANVISVSTNSRHLSQQLAAEAARIAAERVKIFSPEIVLKKIDSRLKGNIVNECTAVLTVFHRERLLVVPAAPDIGRYVLNGAVVGAGVDCPISIALQLVGSDLPCDIPDAGSADVMLDLARSFLHRKGELPVCSRGFAIALAKCLFTEKETQGISLRSPHLIAIGSRDPVTIQQLELICRNGMFLCLEAPEGEVPELSATAQKLLLHCTGPMQQPSETVAQHFAEGVARAINTTKPLSVLCSGGDTASAVLRHFDQSILQVFGEAGPGLPVSLTKLAGREVTFISKSGGFGVPSTLLEVFSNQQGNFRPEA